METVPLKRFWPYDEVTAIGDCSSAGKFSFSTPWSKVDIEVEREDIARTTSVVEKICANSLSANDLANVSWLFSPLSQYSLTYILPQSEGKNNSDQHMLMDHSLLGYLPRSMLTALSHSVLESSLDAARIRLAFDRLLEQPEMIVEWKWDISAALSFSAVSGGYDPMSLFSVVRRFHLLESVENNRTEELNRFLLGFQSDKEGCRDALAKVVRQNHYVTQKCDSALRPALGIAKSAITEVKNFMRAESGHDTLLERALKTLGIVDPAMMPASDPVIVLMEVFRLTACRNFLAFSMVVDMFERSSYLEQDPLATLLESHGHLEAAKQIDLHREINDSGGHENVALGFLEFMSPVDAKYATEAMHLAELVTYLIHRLSTTLLKDLKH